MKAKVAQPKIERGWKNVPNRAEVEQRIKTENPKNVPPPTRAAAREGGSAAPGAAATSPGPRGRQGRVAPGETAAPSLGGSPAPFERGKGRAGGRPRPGATAMPGEGAERVSPQPFEQGKPGGRGRPGITPPATGPREGLSPAPFERGQGRGKAGERSPGQGGGRSASRSSRILRRRQHSERAPQPQPERGRPPGRRPGEEPNAGQGAPEQVPPQNRERGPERQRFGTPRLWAQVNTGNLAKVRHRTQVSMTVAAGRNYQRRLSPRRRLVVRFRRKREAQREKEVKRLHGQPGGPPRGGAPGAAERGQAQGQPEGGKRKPEKGTPPPRPQ